MHCSDFIITEPPPAFFSYFLSLLNRIIKSSVCAFAAYIFVCMFRSKPI
ncbi:hypothetical protein CLOSTASPAR_05235 [[Clostridium] asparagiforme DSM 15981]|uniref:Uncharacterized protein n=1 Tax=[Clostridium] asparagiforme DSM 15981 TaxID=518636 RepID=C0D7I7_9FIRM|nr:hypothetical protein CLOSTASPAR_05235 [[Clostridium] asparagiforme DSM 15981]